MTMLRSTPAARPIETRTEAPATRRRSATFGEGLTQIPRFGYSCPDCGGPLAFGEGCSLCPICGHSSCA